MKVQIGFYKWYLTDKNCFISFLNWLKQFSRYYEDKITKIVQCNKFKCLKLRWKWEEMHKKIMMVKIVIIIKLWNTNDVQSIPAHSVGWQKLQKNQIEPLIY